MDLYGSGLYPRVPHSNELSRTTRWHGLFDTCHAQIVFDDDELQKHSHYLPAMSCSAWRTRNSIWVQNVYLDSQGFPLPTHGAEDLPRNELQTVRLCQSIINDASLHVPSNSPNDLSDSTLSLSITAQGHITA